MIARALHCPVFIGREDELEALGEARRALGRSRGSVVLIGGEAGIGKSRLLRQFLAVVSRDSRPRNLAVAQCVENAERPFGPFRDLIAALGRNAQAAGAAPDVARALSQLAPAVDPTQTPGATLEKSELFAGIAAYFQALAAKRVTILAIEDLHWADRSSLDFLTYLAPRVADTRLLVIATYRAEDVETREPLFGTLSRLARESTVSRIAVDPFTAAETQRLIDGTLSGVRDLGVETRSAIVARSEGNPFYAEELLKDALESRPEPCGSALPISIRGAILERLAFLAPDERRIVAHAAVLGQRFEPETLALSLAIGIDDVLPALRHGRDLNIFVEEDTRPVRFRFRHALTRQAVSDDLLRFDVRRVHERLLQTLEALDDTDRHLEALAHHATAAGDAPRALRYNESAGDRALAMRALPEARTFFERASEHAVAVGDRARIGASIAGVVEMQGDAPGARVRYEAAIAAFRELGDFEGAANMVFAVINVMNNMRDFTCVAYGREFLERDGHRIGADHRDALLATIGRLASIQYDYAEAERLLSAVQRPETLAPKRARLSYLLGWMHIAWGAGDVGRWRAAVQTLMALAPSLPAYNAFTVYAVIAQDASTLGCVDVVESAIAAADTLDDLSGFGGLRSFADAVRAFYLFSRGDVAGARERFDRSARASEMPVSRMARWFVGPELAIATGDAALAMAADRDWFDELVRNAKVPWDARAIASGAAWKIASGNVADARQLLRVALGCLERPVPGTLLALTLCAERLEGEDLERLHRVLGAELHPDDAAGRAAVSFARAILAHRFGDAAVAEARALAAARDFERLGWPMFEARALELAGHDAAAGAIYERCGAVVQAARLAPPVSVAIAPESEALSQRERAIADLIVLGETNAQIGERLAISVKTVEKHVSSIFLKLGIRNRAQIAATFAQRA